MRTDSADNVEREGLISRIIRRTAFTVFILLAVFVVLLFQVMWVIGTREGEGPNLFVENQLDESVTLLFEGRDVDEVAFLTIPAGESRIADFPCLSKMARTDDGRLVDEWDAPSDCSGDQHWVITQSETS